MIYWSISLWITNQWFQLEAFIHIFKFHVSHKCFSVIISISHNPWKYSYLILTAPPIKRLRVCTPDYRIPVFTVWASTWSEGEEPFRMNSSHESRSAHLNSGPLCMFPFLHPSDEKPADAALCAKLGWKFTGRIEGNLYLWLAVRRELLTPLVSRENGQTEVHRSMLGGPRKKVPCNWFEPGIHWRNLPNTFYSSYKYILFI